MQQLYPIPGCVVERVSAEAEGSPVLRVRASSDQACCPGCHTASRAPHSTYLRRPADLPSLGRCVRLEIVVRRFYCAERTCARRTFAERLPGLLDVHARRTRRLAAAQFAVAIEVGAEAGARLAAQLAMPVSTYRICLSRQLCWAHLKRNAEGLGLRGGSAEAFACWATAECDRLFALWHQWKQAGAPRPELARALVPLKARFARLLRRGAACADPKVAAFCRNLQGLWSALWTFGTCEVEPTNNAAERALRRGVLWRKGCFGSQSGAGLRFVERTLTLTETARQNRVCALDYLTRAIAASRAGAPAPPLLPTP